MGDPRGDDGGGVPTAVAPVVDTLAGPREPGIRRCCATPISPPPVVVITPPSSKLPPPSTPPPPPPPPVPVSISISVSPAEAVAIRIPVSGSIPFILRHSLRSEASCMSARNLASYADIMLLCKSTETVGTAAAAATRAATSSAAALLVAAAAATER